MKELMQGRGILDQGLILHYWPHTTYYDMQDSYQQNADMLINREKATIVVFMP